MRFHFKLMSSEITATLFVLPWDIPLSLRLAAVPKNSSRQAWTYRESPNRIFPQKHLS